MKPSTNAFENWGISLGYSLVSSLVHNTPEKLENTALSLWLGLPFTLIRHTNGAFQKLSLKRRNFETPAVCVRVDGKHFANEAFWKR